MGFGRRGERVAKTPCGRESAGFGPIKLTCAIEDPEDIEVGKTLDVCKADFKLGKNMNVTLGFVLRA